MASASLRRPETHPKRRGAITKRRRNPFVPAPPYVRHREHPTRPTVQGTETRGGARSLRLRPTSTAARQRCGCTTPLPNPQGSTRRWDTGRRSTAHPRNTPRCTICIQHKTTRRRGPEPPPRNGGTESGCGHATLRLVDCDIRRWRLTTPNPWGNRPRGRGCRQQSQATVVLAHVPDVPTFSTVRFTSASGPFGATCAGAPNCNAGAATGRSANPNPIPSQHNLTRWRTVRRAEHGRRKHANLASSRETIRDLDRRRSWRSLCRHAQG